MNFLKYRLTKNLRKKVLLKIQDPNLNKKKKKKSSLYFNVLFAKYKTNLKMVNARMKGVNLICKCLLLITCFTIYSGSVYAKQTISGYLLFEDGSKQEFVALIRIDFDGQTAEGRKIILLYV